MNDNDHGYVGQNLCGPFIRAVPAMKVKENDRRVAADDTTKVLVSPGEFQHQNCTVGTVHDSDHDDVVRILVHHSCHSNELIS